MTVTESTQSKTSDLLDVVSHIEQRVHHGGARERRMLERARNLNAYAAYQWPSGADASYSLALRLLKLADSLRREAPRTQEVAEEMAELALGRLHQALESTTDDPERQARDLIDFWEHQTILPRHLVDDVLADAADTNLLEALSRLLKSRIAGKPVSESGEFMQSRATARTQDFHVLLARLQSELGALDESLATLEEAFESDGFVLETTANMLVEQGEIDQAIERLEKATLVSDAPELLYEQLYELHSEKGNQDAAVDVLKSLLVSTHEILYWNILIQELDDQPARLLAIRDEIAEEYPGLHVEIMMSESDARGVAKAARGKNFTADELWSIGHYLAPIRPAAASKLFLRALALQGAASHSRLECEALGERVESVMRFFRERDKIDRLEKAFKQTLDRHKRNVPLQREFERLFR